jgi:hypothetical protein
VKEVRTLLQEQVGKNIEVLMSIRDNPDAKDADRIACIREINDRALGRAAQAVEHSGNIGSGASPENHKPDMANRLAGLRERVIAETAAERQAVVTTAVAGQDGQTIPLVPSHAERCHCPSASTPSSDRRPSNHCAAGVTS